MKKKYLLGTILTASALVLFSSTVLANSTHQNYIDKNDDGICDNRPQLMHDNKHSLCHNEHKENCPKPKSQHHQQNYVDENKDAICDNQNHHGQGNHHRFRGGKA